MNKRLAGDSMQLQPLDERNGAIAAVLDGVADRLGAKSSQVPLAWLIARGVLPIVGATRPERHCDDLAAVDLDFDAAAIEELDAASAIDLAHLYQMVGWEMQMALGYGGMFDQIEIPAWPFR